MTGIGATKPEMVETRVKAVGVVAGLLLSAAVVGLFSQNRVESEFGQGTMLASLQSRLEAAAAVPPRAFRSCSDHQQSVRQHAGGIVCVRAFSARG